MNKRVLNISLFLLLASTGNVLAQQGIGTNTPHRSAALHVDSQNKGLLIPRMNLTHSQTDGITAPITNPAQGLLVYNNQSYPVNATGQDVLVPEGFYYFDGTNWNPISKSYLEDGSYTTILGTGTASDPYKVNVAKASDENLGVVQIGSGINIDANGVISVPAAPGETTTEITDLLTGTNKHKIANYKNETTNAPVDIFETVTSLSQNIDGISYTNENNTNTLKAKVVSADTDNLITIGDDFGAFLAKEDVQNNQVKYEVINGNNTTASLDSSSTTDLQKYKVDVTFPTIDGSETKLIAGLNTTVSGTGTTASPYTVDVNKATASTLGVVMPGTNVTVDTDGKLNVALDGSETKLADGLITTVDGAGTTASPYTVDVNKATASTLGVVMPGTNMTVDTDGKLNVALDGSETKLTDGTNTTVAGSGTDGDKYKVNVATGNDRTLGVVREAETNPTVNVTNGELAVNLAYTILSGEVTGPLNATIVADDVIDAANLKTDAVVTTKIANANVTPVKIQPATTFTQTQVMVTGTDGAVKWVDQSTISPATTVSNTSSDNTLITTVNSVSSTSVDLVKTVGLSLTGNNLTATVNGVSNATPLDLSGIDTDEQNLTFTSATNKLSIERGNEVDLSKYDTKLANGTNTTISGNGSTTPYQVNVATATTAAVGVVKPGTGLNVATDGTLNVTVIDTNTDNQTLSYDDSTKKLSIVRGNEVDLSALATDNNTITTVKANAAQPYVSVTSTPATPGVTQDREYTVGVNAATAQVGTTAGTSGVVKPGSQFKVETDGHLSVKYAMPQFFYMPSILIDTSVITPSGSPDLTVNLYTQYTGQFNVTNANMRSATAPAQIPVLPAATDLYYYVTYSDTSSIQITGISDNGVMSYRVLGNTNSLSFVNIVFVIK